MKTKQKFSILEKYAENNSSFANGIVSDTSKSISTLDVEEAGEVHSVECQSMVQSGRWNPFK